MIKNIAILGSSGSVGTQALDVIRENPNRFKVSVLTVQHNAELLIKQALEFLPHSVVITNEEKYQEVKSALSHTSINVLSGETALIADEQLHQFEKPPD